MTDCINSDVNFYGSVHIKGNGNTQKWLTETGICYCNLSTAQHSINRLVNNNYSAAIVFRF